MTKPELHPWLSTPQALKAANDAVKYAARLVNTRHLGDDELLSEALILLTECALPAREREVTVCLECGKSLENRRRGAKFCSETCNNRNGQKRHRAKTAPAPASTKTHVGSMWSWPEDQRGNYAVREVGVRLCHLASKRRVEVPSSEWFEEHSPSVQSAEEKFFESEGSQALELLVEYLSSAQTNGETK